VQTYRIEHSPDGKKIEIQRKGREEEIKRHKIIINIPNKSAADRKAYGSNEKSHTHTHTTNAASVTCVLLM